jgi:ubiquinone/menaquinone biosynthesis C-methylase UbiE
MTTIYEDDAVVGELTRLAFDKTNSRLLQIHRFAATDVEHVDRLWEIFAPAYGEHIADVGCGVGSIARLAAFNRPDLTFTLINKSCEQLEMCPWRFERIHGVAEDLPLRHEQVDAIMVTYALGHFDLRKFVSECVRVGVRRVYVFDLFKRDAFCDCRVASDLCYEERTIDQVIDAFWLGGFKVTNRDITTFVPDDIAALMPSPETLNNTVSAALVFER